MGVCGRAKALVVGYRTKGEVVFADGGAIGTPLVRSQFSVIGDEAATKGEEANGVGRGGGGLEGRTFLVQARKGRSLFRRRTLAEDGGGWGMC